MSAGSLSSSGYAPSFKDMRRPIGEKWVWCTFSRDRLDWDFSNPEVLYEFIDLLVTYIEKGATWLRVDAVAYLWKDAANSKRAFAAGPCGGQASPSCLREHLARHQDSHRDQCASGGEPQLFWRGRRGAHCLQLLAPPILTHAILTGRSDRITSGAGRCRCLPKGAPI